MQNGFTAGKLMLEMMYLYDAMPMSTYLTKQTPATTSPIRPAMEQPATTAENNSNNYPLLPVTTCICCRTCEQFIMIPAKVYTFR